MEKRVQKGRSSTAYETSHMKAKADAKKTKEYESGGREFQICGAACWKERLDSLQREGMPGL